MFGHHVVEINDLQTARIELDRIGASVEGVQYMAPKAVFRCIKLKGIPLRSANIIKQEMLSKGGEAAIAKHAVAGEGNTDILLLGTLRHYELLLSKLSQQPFGLSELADEIELILSAQDKKDRKMELANGKTLEFGKHTLVMGILNVTPDSFSDGGRYFKLDDALAHAYEMCEEGADLLDIGGASSRPNSIMADEEEELRRVLPVIERLAREGVTLSVDTFRANVARKALENGAHIINDIGNLQMDEGLLPVLVDWQAPVILMHNRMQLPQKVPYNDLISDIIGALKSSMQKAQDAGLPADKIIIDPGVGFGNTAAEDRVIIKSLRSFTSCNCPVLLGTSRKSFIGKTLGLEVEDRLEASLATVAIGIMNGADIVRVHDVKQTKRLSGMIDAVQAENG